MAEVLMFGGANGSGKTTVALTMLPTYFDVYEFVNADEIAKGLNPLKPETANISAGRVMIRRISDLTESKKNFAFETTCAGKRHIHTFNRCREVGYSIHMIFLWLPSPEAAIERVKARVLQGGHSIPEDTIHRRYQTGLSNAINLYLPMVNNAIFIDNSDYDPKNIKKIAEKKAAAPIKIYNSSMWSDIVKFASKV